MRDREGTDLEGEHSEVVPLKHHQISTRLYGITSQKTLFFTVINIRMSDLKTLLSHQTVSALLVLYYSTKCQFTLSQLWNTWYEQQRFHPIPKPFTNNTSNIPYLLDILLCKTINVSFLTCIFTEIGSIKVI